MEKVKKVVFLLSVGVAVVSLFASFAVALGTISYLATYNEGSTDLSSAAFFAAVDQRISLSLNVFIVSILVCMVCLYFIYRDIKNAVMRDQERMEEEKEEA